MAMALSYELEGKVDILCYEPGSVSTDFVKDGVTADRAAEVCFRDLGHEIHSHGAFRHEMAALFARMIPDSM